MTITDSSRDRRHETSMQLGLMERFSFKATLPRKFNPFMTEGPDDEE